MVRFPTTVSMIYKFTYTYISSYPLLCTYIYHSIGVVFFLFVSLIFSSVKIGIPRNLAQLLFNPHVHQEGANCLEFFFCLSYSFYNKWAKKKYKLIKIWSWTVWWLNFAWSKQTLLRKILKCRNLISMNCVNQVLNFKKSVNKNQIYL